MGKALTSIKPSGASQSTLTIKEGTVSVSPYISSGHSVYTVNFPSSMKIIGDSAFANSYITTLTLPENVEEIGGSAFYTCTNLTTANIPGKVKKIPYRCFYSCSKLSSMTISEGVEIIGNISFQSCSALKELILPSTIKTIETDAFRNCALTSLTCLATTPPEFASSYQLTITTVYVPTGCYDIYKAANYWKNFNIVELS